MVRKLPKTPATVLSIRERIPPKAFRTVRGPPPAPIRRLEGSTIPSDAKYPSVKHRSRLTSGVLSLDSIVAVSAAEAMG